jgi:hypothetical protein
MLTVAVASKELQLDLLFDVIAAKICCTDLYLVPLDNLIITRSTNL